MSTRKRDETVVPTRALSELGERGLWTTGQDREGGGSKTTEGWSEVMEKGRNRSNEEMSGVA